MGDSPEKLISQEISVVRSDVDGRPTSFQWNGREYIIKDIIAVWPDWGFSAGAPPRKTWRMRRHRNCYRVETTAGEVFELYHDRGIKLERGKWFLRAKVA